MRFDRAGADRVVEVYPAAALLLWGIERHPYMTSRDPERREAEGSARAAALDLTVLPQNGDLKLARSEGWIHLPQRQLAGTAELSQAGRPQARASKHRNLIPLRSERVVQHLLSPA